MLCRKCDRLFHCFAFVNESGESKTMGKPSWAYVWTVLLNAIFRVSEHCGFRSRDSALLRSQLRQKSPPQLRSATRRHRRRLGKRKRISFRNALAVAHRCGSAFRSRWSIFRFVTSHSSSPRNKSVFLHFYAALLLFRLPLLRFTITVHIVKCVARRLLGRLYPEFFPLHSPLALCFYYQPKIGHGKASGENCRSCLTPH